mmetsp:Transcript_58406/g.134830  ORF Transcript_58406/g.134830 Transcript_58406/m.134830 type:complete len:130 (+) Transcript_58406:165-554(+)
MICRFSRQLQRQSFAVRSLSLAGSIRYTGASVDLRRKRRFELIYQAQHTGWLELDCLLGGFAQRRLSAATICELDLFEEIIDMSNEHIHDVLTGQRELADDEAENDMLIELLEYVNSRHPALLKLRGEQ